MVIVSRVLLEQAKRREFQSEPRAMPHMHLCLVRNSNKLAVGAELDIEHFCFEVKMVQHGELWEID